MSYTSPYFLLRSKLSMPLHNIKRLSTLKRSRLSKITTNICRDQRVQTQRSMSRRLCLIHRHGSGVQSLRSNAMLDPLDESIEDRVGCRARSTRAVRDTGSLEVTVVRLCVWIQCEDFFVVV